MKFFKLPLINRCRRIDHYIPSGVVLGESDKVADGFLASKYSHQAVQTKGDASMWWSTIFESA